MDRRSLIGGVAASGLATILTSGVARAAGTMAKADAIYPYLKMYLGAPPDQRTHFLLAYYVMRDHKPAPDVKAALVSADGHRRPIVIGADGRVETLPTLAELNANIQVEVDTAPSDKVVSIVQILANAPQATRLDTHALVQAMAQANAAIAAHAGVLAFAAPKLTCAYMFGSHSGQAVLANGKSVALPLRTGPNFPGAPYFDSVAMPDAREVVLDKAPSRVVLGGHPRN